MDPGPSQAPVRATMVIKAAARTGETVRYLYLEEVPQQQLIFDLLDSKLASVHP
jgi:hypothetical protein